MFDDEILEADTSAQIPAAGPIANDTPSGTATPATTEPGAPATSVVEPTATAPVSQGEARPAVLPSSARRASGDGHATAAAFVLLLAVGVALV